MDNDYKKIEDRFKSLPKDIQFALTSIEVANTIKEIAEKNNLLLDQSSTLFDLTSDVLLGISPSDDFVKVLSRDAVISHDSATSIAQEINSKIFDKLRSSMRKVQEEKTKITKTEEGGQGISDLERIGDFRILKEDDNSKNGNKDSLETTGVENIQGDNLLESPVVVAVPTAEKKVMPKVPPNLPIENNSSKPLPVQVEEKQPASLSVFQKPQTAPPPSQTPPLPKKSYEKDPYREPF